MRQDLPSALKERENVLWTLGRPWKNISQSYRSSIVLSYMPPDCKNVSGVNSGELVIWLMKSFYQCKLPVAQLVSTVVEWDRFWSSSSLNTARYEMVIFLRPTTWMKNTTYGNRRYTVYVIRYRSMWWISVNYASNWPFVWQHLCHLCSLEKNRSTSFAVNIVQNLWIRSLKTKRFWANINTSKQWRSELRLPTAVGQIRKRICHHIDQYVPTFSSVILSVISTSFVACFKTMWSWSLTSII